MAFINQNYGEIKIDKQLNVSADGATTSTTSTGSATDAATGAATNVKQMTKRQIVILMTSLFDIPLNHEYTNQKQLATFLSLLTGLSAEGFRQAIMKLAKDGQETAEARKDARIVADAIEPFDSKTARKIRNGAED